MAYSSVWEANQLPNEGQTQCVCYILGLEIGGLNGRLKISRVGLLLTAQSNPESGAQESPEACKLLFITPLLAETQWRCVSA